MFDRSHTASQALPSFILDDNIMVAAVKVSVYKVKAFQVLG